MKDNWENFENKCKNCRSCGLCETRKNVVIYRGSLSCPLLILGEGPGADEDEQGIPFVGRSGKLLDYLLAAHGLDNSLFHIANIVKCRPPKNRRPSPEEVSACKALLDEQIAMVNPEIILLLGSTAYSSYTSDTAPISRARGTWISEGEKLLMPSFHPAYLLRSPQMKIHLWNDLEAVRKKLEEKGFVPELRFTPPFN